MIKQVTEQEMIDEGYMDGVKSFDYLFKKIEKTFEWEKVYKAMKALDWHWCIHNEDYGIPNVCTLKNRARNLLFDVYEAKKDSISTGGFSAGWENGHLWLTFEIDGCHTSDL